MPLDISGIIADELKRTDQGRQSREILKENESEVYAGASGTDCKICSLYRTRLDNLLLIVVG